MQDCVTSVKKWKEACVCQKPCGHRQLKVSFHSMAPPWEGRERTEAETAVSSAHSSANMCIALLGMVQVIPALLRSILNLVAHLWPLTCVWKTEFLCPHVCGLCFPHFPLISLHAESCDPRSLLWRGECWCMCCSGLNITCREKRGGCKNCQVTAFPVIWLPR